MGKMGRPLAIDEEHHAQLRELVRGHPNATMRELAQSLAEQGGPRVSTVTLAAALRRAGLKRVAQPSAVLYAKPSEPAHYGYSDSHRLEPADPGKYTSCLTDAEWALAADLFERPEGHRGRPAVYERRRMVKRTHAWNERSRRLIMHHDRSIASATAWVWLSQARLLVRRLTNA